MNPRAFSIGRPLLIATVLVLLGADAVFAQQLSRREMELGKAIQRSIGSVEEDYFNGKYTSAGVSVRRAAEQIDSALEVGGEDFFKALKPLLARLDKAHALLELEGVSLPPFEMPSGPGEKPMFDVSSPDTANPSTPAANPSTGTVSFASDVAPILNAKCGRCHVQGTRGNFSLASYAALMKGPPEGVVVFAGDVIGSRLIETIETGDMPRGGGRVTPEELKTLKTWITEGAKFDGTDPTASISASGTTPAPAATPMPVKVTRATGKETVSFASDVAPLLVDNCGGCHIDAMQTRGGLRLDTIAQMMRGGDSGAIVVPGRGEASLLVKKLRGTATDGERMPAGGRDPLSDDSIALISKWIDEGATIDADESQPVTVISKLAWAAKATSEEISARRAELADRHLELTGGAVSPSEVLTEHFRIVGVGAEATLDLVGRLAEGHMKSAKAIARAKSASGAEDYFKGRATIFVMPKRYDYSEFAKMVERRSIPVAWQSHWKFDGIDAYIAVVATERDEEEAIESRLLSSVVSLAVATRGGDVPRWFAEGIGSATALQQNAKSRAEQQALQASVAAAASNIKNAKSFLDNRLTPEQTDSFATAVAFSMLDRNRRRSLESCLRVMAEGKSFAAAFQASFGANPEAYIDAYLKFVR